MELHHCPEEITNNYVIILRYLNLKTIIALVIPPLAFIIAYISGSMIFLDYIHVLIGAVWTGVDVNGIPRFIAR